MVKLKNLWYNYRAVLLQQEEVNLMFHHQIRNFLLNVFAGIAANVLFYLLMKLLNV